MYDVAGHAIGLVVVGLLFVAAERLWPSVRGQRFLRREFRTDLAYYFLSPLVNKVLGGLLAAALLAPPLLLMGRDLNANALRDGFGPVALQPVWLQALEVLVLGDLLGYWVHRGFHSARLWRFHAVHHSPRELDWLSSFRQHPVNESVGGLVLGGVFILLGFNLTLVGLYVPFLVLYALSLHANVTWGFGPLGGWLASPTWHRWHHSRQPSAIDMNYAPMFVIWDRLFGTFYWPREQQAFDFGITSDDMPPAYLGQLAYPFRRRQAAPKPAEA